MTKKVDDISLFLGDEPENIPDGRLAVLYVVLLAIRGDKLAEQLLDAAGYTVYDAEGNIIFPVPPKKEP